MSVYKAKGSPYYQFDFEVQRHRFFGSTKKTSRREAEQCEQEQRKHVIKTLDAAGAHKVSLAMSDVTARYWVEVGQHHAGAGNTLRDLNRLVDYFTPVKLLTEITDDDVAKMVAWRRRHLTRGGKGVKPAPPAVSNATVNRSTTEVLKKLFTRAKIAWGVRFEHEPRWRSHMLPEPQERVRELVGGEGVKLDAAMRADYAPFFAFAAASGLRLSECLLRWSEVNWETKRIQKLGKGKKLVTVPITSIVRQILWPLKGHHAEFVFTYLRKGKKAKRRPLTRSGVKTEWRRMRGRAGVEDFRFHDLRHDLATKLLRATGNLKLVQRALNHRDLKTTLRYAHVLDSEVATALESVTKRSESREVSC